MDGIANLSARPSIVQAAVLRYEDLTPGTLVNGRVVRMGSFGVVVALSELVEGLVAPMHLADSKLRKASAMYKVGKRVKCRVLTADPVRRRALLTLKPTLVKSELPLLVAYPDGNATGGALATPGIGSVVHGFVTAVKSAGLIVTFYNNVHGLVPLGDLKKQVRGVHRSARGGGRVVRVGVVEY